MKEYIKNRESQSPTVESNSNGFRQPPVSEILQAYRNGTLGRSPIQRESIEEDDDLTSGQPPVSTILQQYSEKRQWYASEEDEEILQGKFETVQRQEKTNNTGLPDNLKSGIENLSGYSMDDVKVYYNSDKPTQLNALAYAQGTDIHVAPGQEQYLPHEAWHVVQQKQGRVQTTIQMQGVNVNDNEGLEKEADVMAKKIKNSNAKTRLEQSEPASFFTQYTNDVQKVFEYSETSNNILQMAGHAGVMLFGNNNRLWKRVEANESEQYLIIMNRQAAAAAAAAEEEEEEEEEVAPAEEVVAPAEEVAAPAEEAPAPAEEAPAVLEDIDFQRVFPHIFNVRRDGNVPEINGTNYPNQEKRERWLEKHVQGDHYVEMESIGGQGIDVLDFKIGTITAQREDLIHNYGKTEAAANSKVRKMAGIDNTTESARYGLRDSDALKSSIHKAICRWFGVYRTTLNSIRRRIAADGEHGYDEDAQVFTDLRNIQNFIEHSNTLYIASSLVMSFHADRAQKDQDHIVLIDLAHPITTNMGIGNFEDIREGMLRGIRNLYLILRNHDIGVNPISEQPEAIPEANVE